MKIWSHSKPLTSYLEQSMAGPLNIKVALCSTAWRPDVKIAWLIKVLISFKYKLKSVNAKKDTIPNNYIKICLQHKSMQIKFCKL